MNTRVNQGKVMPGGWHFTERGTTMRAGSFDQLFNAVLENRIANGWPVGDVVADLEAAICGAYPKQCRSREGGTMADKFRRADNAKKTRVIDTIVQWAMKMGGQARLVDAGEASRRAEICMRCAGNRLEWRTGCAVCRAQAERLTGIIRKGRDVAVWRKLRGCVFGGHDNRTAVWLDRRQITLNGGEPNECWAKR